MHMNSDESLGIFKGMERETSGNLMNGIRLREWQGIEREE